MHTAGSRMLSWVTVKILAVGIALSLLLAACAPAAAPAPAPAAPAARPTAAPATATPEQPHYSGILTIASISDPPNLDTQQTPSQVYQLVAPAYNNLLYYDFKTGSKAVPELVERWDTSPDGLSYTFKLRKGVRFHDGSALTVEDVVFNLKRMKSPPKGVQTNVGPFMEPVNAIEASGDDTIKIAMKRPFAPLIAALVSDWMPMYSKNTVEKLGDMKKTIMGTGPFKFKSYTPGVSLELVKNDDYWLRGRPYLDGITFQIIPDQLTRLAALRTGRSTMTDRVFALLSPQEMISVKKDVPEMRFIPDPNTPGPWFYMNMRVPPFKDQRVRRAVSLAVDRQSAVKIISEGEGVVGNFFPFAGWGVPRDELMKLPGYRQPKDEDIAAAKKLLAEAGYPNGFSVTISSRSNAVTRNSAIFMVEQLAKIGISATVKVMEDAQFWDSGAKGQFEAMVFTPAASVPDPFAMVRFMGPGGALNVSGADTDARLNELWQKQLAASEEKARKAAIEELERYLLTDLVPSVPLVWPSTFLAMSHKVMGYAPGVTHNSNNRHQETWLAQ